MMLNVSFITGTRADYGKIRPIIEYLLNKNCFNIYIFVCGMHLQKKYGYTIKFIEKDFDKSCNIIRNQQNNYEDTTSRTSIILKNYGKHLSDNNIDFVFVHGDRPDALAAAIASSFHNIPICHIEAGDLSGSIDESLRHAISKLSHKFFVSDNQAKKILYRLGENPNDIYVIGDTSLANDLPNNKYWRFPFSKYAILMYHPITTAAPEHIRHEIKEIMKQLITTNLNYVVIMPNNDQYNEIIVQEYALHQNNPHFKFYKSFSFDAFANILKHSLFLIGNSSCAIKEAPHYNIPAIDIGQRQKGRYNHLDSDFFVHIDSAELIPDILNKINSKPNNFNHIKYRKRLFCKLDKIITDDFFRPQIQKQIYVRGRNVQ